MADFCSTGKINFFQMVIGFTIIIISLSALRDYHYGRFPINTIIGIATLILGIFLFNKSFP